jgi:hypothetical protein
MGTPGTERGERMAQSSRCERCDGPLVSITLTVGGERRTMRSCSRCDHRTWLADGRRIGLDGVLSDLRRTGRRPERRLPSGRG